MLLRSFHVGLFCCAALAVASPGRAADWMFQRSYYSHDPVQPIRIGPQAPVGGPYYSRVQGQFTTSTLRVLRSSIVVGNSVDNYYTWEGSVKGGVQY